MAMINVEEAARGYDAVALVKPGVPSSKKDDIEAAARRQLEKARELAMAVQARTLKLVRDPSFQTCTLSTAGGAVTLGACGGAFGLASGVVVGAGAGLIPAIFTFGLSVPVGAAVGGATGLGLGSLAGGGAGGATGFAAYKYRVEIRDGLVFVKAKAHSTAESAKLGAKRTVLVVRTQANGAITYVQKKVNDTVALAKDRSDKALKCAKATSHRAYELARTPRAKVTATGLVAGGALGGTAGATVGTVAGAAIGLVPALFTFGLSIPAGAVVGCCAGALTGGGAGAVGGGAVAYGGYSYRAELRGGVGKAWDGASDAVHLVKSKASETASAATGKVKSLLGSTGGSA